MLESYTGVPGTLKVRKPKAANSDVTVRESLDELTLTAEEVKTSKALININHIEPERWSPPKVDADTGMPSARRCSKASKEKTGKKCMTPTR